MLDDPAWVPTVFTKNQNWKKRCPSDKHFSVDGTLIQARASHKSFVRKDGPGFDFVIPRGLSLSDRIVCMPPSEDNKSR